MKTSIFLTGLLGLLLVSTAIADPGDTLWTRTYGGTDYDWGFCVDQTTDGGYIIAGMTKSFGAGSWDIYLLKTDANGDTLWARTHGGSGEEGLYGDRSVQQTTDGGYIIAGYTASFGAGDFDFWLLKIDTKGDTLWTRTYGGEGTDIGRSLQQTTDGGYIITGYTQPFSGGVFDIYLVKTDANGDTLWTRTYGGTDYDLGFCVDQTTDGGYIIAGRTTSFGAGSQDVYLVKTDANGDTLWTRAYGGTSSDNAYSVQQTTDGGYIVAGKSESFGPDNDAWLLKTDTNGDTLWTRLYGVIGGGDGAHSVQQTTDGGYVIAGNLLTPPPQYYQLWLLKTDAAGDTLWTRTYGRGSGFERGQSVQQTSDGGYIVAGYTTSVGYEDVYLVRVAGEAQPDVSIEIVPDDPPVTVPQGGSFGFTGTLTNNTEETQVVDAWTMAIGPQKEVYGPFKVLNDVELEPFETRSADFNQHVPNLAPLGFYTYIAYCGDYPSTAIDSSFFQIEVIAGPSTEAGETGWVLTGSFLEGDLADLPSEFALLSNYPNPFNAQTVIEYQLPVSSSVRLEVYNLLGNKVATLLDAKQEAGYKSVTWDASEVSSGIYFYKLTAGDYTETRRMMLVK